jgi:hypothetical protein
MGLHGLCHRDSCTFFFKCQRSGLTSKQSISNSFCWKSINNVRTGNDCISSELLSDVWCLLAVCFPKSQWAVSRFSVEPTIRQSSRLSLLWEELTSMCRAASERSQLLSQETIFLERREMSLCRHCNEDGLTRVPSSETWLYSHVLPPSSGSNTKPRKRRHLFSPS